MKSRPNNKKEAEFLGADDDEEEKHDQRTI